MLRRARAKLRRGAAADRTSHADTPPMLVVADVEALPFRAGSFAWGAATLVFCEVPDPVAGLSEVGHALRPGGRIALLEHVRPTGWAGRVADGLTALTGPLMGEHFNRDTERNVASAGIEIERVERLWKDVVVLIIGRHTWSGTIDQPSSGSNLCGSL